jgi:hypothetical protein
VTSDKRLREALVTALLAASRPAEDALISAKLAGEVLDRWDELVAAPVEVKP